MDHGRYQVTPGARGGRPPPPPNYGAPVYGAQRGYRGAPPPRGRGARSRGPSRGAYKQPNVQQDGQKVYDRPYIRNEDVNVQPRACLLCNQFGHSFQSDKCPYFGRTKLWSTPCPSCGIGGHSRKSCLIHPVSTGQNRGVGQNRGGQRRTRNVREESDGRVQNYLDSEDDPEGFLEDLPQGDFPQNF